MKIKAPEASGDDRQECMKGRCTEVFNATEIWLRKTLLLSDFSTTDLPWSHRNYVRDKIKLSHVLYRKWVRVRVREALVLTGLLSLPVWKMYLCLLRVGSCGENLSMGVLRKSEIHEHLRTAIITVKYFVLNCCCTIFTVNKFTVTF